MEKSTENKIYRAIGLMSGTSMDGNDAALLETDGHGHIHFIDFIEESHAADFREQLKACDKRQDRNSDDILAAERAFTLGQVSLIQTLLDRNHLTANDIDIIGFHGQTIFHDPANDVTIQLGDGDLLAQEAGIPVVYDFRIADVKNGGQGAPLIPIYHRALAQADGAQLPIAVVNIGGVSNITWMDDNDNLIGFDTGPGNAMIDDWIKSKTGQPYDNKGKIASEGAIDQDKVQNFMNTPYVQQPYPKSMDRNEFDFISVDDLSVEDGAATLMEIAVQGIAKGLQDCPSKPTTVYITGGGRHNTAMMERLATVADVTVASVDDFGWRGDSMEAEGFAYMAVRTLLNEPISFPYTTGCNAPTVGGIMVGPKKTERRKLPIAMTSSLN